METFAMEKAFYEIASTGEEFWDSDMDPVSN